MMNKKCRKITKSDYIFGRTNVNLNNLHLFKTVCEDTSFQRLIGLAKCFLNTDLA